MGRIAANDKMPRSKFGVFVLLCKVERKSNIWPVFPPNLDDSLVENTKFTIKMKVCYSYIDVGLFIDTDTPSDRQHRDG